MATTDPETVVSEGDYHHHHHHHQHHQHHHHQAVEKETTDSSNSKEDGNKGEDEISVKELEEAPTEDKLPVVDQPPNLEVPVNAASKQVEAPVPESEASSVLGAAGRAVEEQPQGKPETVAAEQVQERASDLEAAEIEANNKIAPQVTEIVPEEHPTLEPVHKEPEEKPAVDGVAAKENIEKLAVKAVEWELEERRDLESETKTKEEVEDRLDSELKEVPALEVDENQPESSEIETIEKCEDEAVNPTTNEAAADEPVQKVEDVPVQDSDLEIKKEPEETPEPLSQEVEQTSAIDQVVNAPKGEPQEIKNVAEEVEEKTTEEIAEDDEGGKDDKEDGTTSTAPKSVAAETFFPVVEAETDIKQAGVDKVVYESENTETEEINTAARGNVAVEEIAKEDRTAEEGNQEKDVKAVEQTDEMVEKAEESVPTACNNGFGHDETEGKLKDDSVVAEEKDVRVEQVLEEKNACLEGLPPTPSEAASVEDSGSLIARKEVPDKLFEGGQVSRDLEVVKKEAAEELEEEMGTMEPEAGSKDSQSETKVEETMKDDTANEYEPSKASAEQGKPDPSTLEASNSKDVGDDTKATQDIRIPTAEVVKSAHKSSGNILSKVKQSLVKVKKAITGKSPSSKTSSTESKVEDKAK